MVWRYSKKFARYLHHILITSLCMSMGVHRQGLHLPKLDIIQLWIGVNVGVGNADELFPVAALQQGRVQGLQDCNEGHIVLYMRKIMLRVMLFATHQLQRGQIQRFV